MNVLIIAQYFPPDFGGASTRAYNAAKGLVLQGCDVSVISAFPHYPHGKIPKNYSRKFISTEQIDGIKLIRTYVPKLSHSSNFKRLFLHFSFFLSSLFAIRYVKNSDVIISMNQNIFGFFPSYVINLFLRKPIIRNLDDLWPEVFYDLGIVKSKPIKKILDYFAKKSYEIPKAITPISKGYVNTLITKYNINKEKIFVIEQGVDLKKFSSTPNVDSKIKTIMYSGIINFNYDFETIIDAAKLLQSEPVKFVIRGTGDSISHITNLIKKNNLTNVVLDTNLVSKEKLGEILSSADIFILPLKSVGSADFGLPTKILEFQALRKPIICFSVGEPARYIRETNSGLICDANPSDLANKIKQLLDDPSLTTQLGNNGYTFIKNNLTIEKVGKRFLQVINTVTKKST